ncbi:unnamed protein product [Rotaria socialis]|uniref:Uncharacterized protein n=1 Tax=Rotaria socialis TaxID=392032 RepID=A0A817XN49_9BILA|nr:unnamed protein product [Rotaria socialis]CAF4565857.1 unnamed protein product [Rotaria socialis]CAF4907532.1 unnamed protein product [Rotaria socialis]
MYEIENLILILANLKHFELDAVNSATDLADGQRLEKITGRLVTFNFIFLLTITEVEQVLGGFRTWFWREKRWFVVYENAALFTVPRFAQTHCIDSFQRPFYSTCVDENIFINKITMLELSKSLVDAKHYFPNVRTLNIKCDVVQLENLTFVIDINRLEHLILSFPIRSSMLDVHKLLNMHGIRKLSIMTDSVQLLEQFKGMQFKNITTLEIKSENEFRKAFNVEQLCSIFPLVERLNVKPINKETIIRMTDGFSHLSNASFYLDLVTWGETAAWQVKPERALYATRQLLNSAYTCRYKNRCLHAWISKQVSQFLLKET